MTDCTRTYVRSAVRYKYLLPRKIIKKPHYRGFLLFAPKSRIMLIEYTYEGKEIVFSKYFAYIEYPYEGKEIVFSKYFAYIEYSYEGKEIVFSQRTCFKTHSNKLEMHIIVHWVAPLTLPPRPGLCPFVRFRRPEDNKRPAYKRSVCFGLVG